MPRNEALPENSRFQLPDSRFQSVLIKAVVNGYGYEMPFDTSSGMYKLTLAMRNTSNISLPPSLRQAINRRVESGRYQSAGEVVQEALHLLDERDKSRHSGLAQLRAEIAVGLTQATSGELRDGKDVLRRILKKVKPIRRNTGSLSE